MSREDIEERRRILHMLYEQIEKHEDWCEMMRQAIWDENEKLFNVEDSIWNDQAIYA